SDLGRAIPLGTRVQQVSQFIAGADSTFDERSAAATELLAGTVAGLSWLCANCYPSAPPRPTNRPPLDPMYRQLFVELMRLWTQRTDKEPKGSQFIEFATTISNVARDRTGEKRHDPEGLRSMLRQCRHELSLPHADARPALNLNVLDKEM